MLLIITQGKYTKYSRVKQTECSETVEEGLFNSDLRDRECKVRFYPEEETGGGR